MFLIDDGMFCVLNLIIWDYIIVELRIENANSILNCD